MMPPCSQTITPVLTVTKLLDGWIAASLPQNAHDWFRSQLEQMDDDASDHHLTKALDSASATLGQTDLVVSTADLTHAAAIHPGFDPSNWLVDQAARVRLILASFNGDEAQFAARLDHLTKNTELNALIALYKGFALYPAAAEIKPFAQAAAGSNEKPVFEAIAHHNPYPVAHFDDTAWNRMVLKTFTMQSPLWPVQGIDKRANPMLADSLLDLAQAEWAAGRPTSPELWRCVGPHANQRGLAMLLRVIETGTEPERIGACLSLNNVRGGGAAQLRTLCHRQGLTQRTAAATWPMLSPWKH
jgi:hypothetical protein